MFHEITMKFKVNHQRNKIDAKNIAETIIKHIREYEESAIVFIENPVITDITEIGIDCHTCKYCWSDEVIIGDRGYGIETMVKYYCTVKNEEIIPSTIDFCDKYIKRGRL